MNLTKPRGAADTERAAKRTRRWAGGSRLVVGSPVQPGNKQRTVGPGPTVRGCCVRAGLPPVSYLEVSEGHNTNTFRGHLDDALKALLPS